MCLNLTLSKQSWSVIQHIESIGLRYAKQNIHNMYTIFRKFGSDFWFNAIKNQLVYKPDSVHTTPECLS